MRDTSFAHVIHPRSILTLALLLSAFVHRSYADIYRWGGSSSQFSLIIWNQSSESTFALKLSTAQAADMAGIILDYINAIMAAAQADG